MAEHRKTNVSIARVGAVAALAALAFVAGLLAGSTRQPHERPPAADATPATPPASEHPQDEHASGGNQPSAGPRDNLPSTSSSAMLRIVDGDTVEVLWHWPQPLPAKVRFLGIDTPERGEPGYREATDALRQLLGARRVRLEFETPGVPKRDGFGRLLAYVWASGINTNVALVRQGWARLYRDRATGRHAAELKRALAEARAARRGLWHAQPEDRGSR